MAAQIISFFQRAPSATRDWSQQEVAEFYRVESALVQGGVQLESDRGLSDEGDPWFIFCRGDNGEVFMHFARIDGLYVIDGAAFDEPARGPDFPALIRQLIGRYPLARARQRPESNIFVHPAALLIALVGAAFFHTNEAKAAEIHDAKPELRRHTSLLATSAPAPAMAVSGGAPKLPETDAAQVAAVLLSAVLALHEESLRVPRDLAPPNAFAVVSTPGISGDFATMTGSAVLVWDHTVAQVAPGLAATSSETAGPAIIPNRGAALGPAGMAGPVSADLTVPLVMSESAPAATPDVPAPLEATAMSPGRAIFAVKIMATAPAATIEAIAVVASTQAVSEMVAKALPQIDRLPTTLLDLIGKGAHIDGAAPPLSANSAPPEVISSQPAPADPPAGPPIPVLHGHDPAIDAAVAQFLTQVKHLDMFVQDKQLVLVDRDIYSPFAADLDLDSVTFTFSDGSSVSLVGTVGELHQFHWAT